MPWLSNLGVMYDEGTGVPEDDAEAVRWFRLAAEQGNAKAQFKLGAVPEQGNAVRLYRLAAGGMLG